jgi:hypothetical protein
MANRSVCLLCIGVVLCLAIQLSAADKSQDQKWAGWVCAKSCIVHSGSTASCNPNCTDNTNLMFISDSGKITQIANPEVVGQYVNKRVTAKAVQQYKNQQQVLQIHELQEGE